MPINNIELTDDFSTWRDNFNLTVNKVNELDVNDSSLPSIETEPTANTLVQRTSTGAVEATSFVEGSSLALKENVRPLDEGLSLINQFNPILFDWRKEFLSNEIVSRYYYQEGRIIDRLKHDKDIDEALRLFAKIAGVAHWEKPPGHFWKLPTKVCLLMSHNSRCNTCPQ